MNKIWYGTLHGILDHQLVLDTDMNATFIVCTSELCHKVYMCTSFTMAYEACNIIVQFTEFNIIVTCKFVEVYK